MLHVFVLFVMNGFESLIPLHLIEVYLLVKLSASGFSISPLTMTHFKNLRRDVVLVVQEDVGCHVAFITLV